MKNLKIDDAYQNEQTWHYIRSRLSQLVQIQDHWGEHCVRFVTFINAGGAIATLSFMGKSDSVRAMFWPKIALACYLAGIILMGLVLKTLFDYTRKYHREITEDAKKFSSRNLRWGKVYQKDEKRLGIIKPAENLGNIAFILFVIGSICGALSLFFYDC